MYIVNRYIATYHTALSLQGSMRLYEFSQLLNSSRVIIPKQNPLQFKQTSTLSTAVQSCASYTINS